MSKEGQPVRQRPILAIVALATGLLAGPRLATPQPQRQLTPIPRPDLEAMEEPIRLGIEEFQAVVDGLADRSDTPPQALATAYGQLGELYHAHGLRDAALAAYGNARTLDPSNAHWAYYLAFLHQDRGELEEAAAAFARVLELEPDDLPTWLRLGSLSLDRNRLEEARRCFAGALALDAASAAAHFGLGRVQAASGEVDAAIESFEKALQLQPEASEVHYPLGLAYRRAGRRDEARRHLEARGDGRVHFADPRVDQLSEILSVSALHALLSLASHRDDFSPRNYLGFAVSQLGDTRGAVEYLRQAVSRKQADGVDAVELARIQYAIGGLLAHRKADAEALAAFAEAVELDSTFTDAHMKLANAQARAGQRSEALASYDRVLALEPENPEARLRRATLRVELGRDDEALADLRRLLELDPESGSARLRLAALLGRRGEAEAALAEYERAIALVLSDEENAVAHLNLARLEEGRGDGDAAMAHYETALRYDPLLQAARLGLAAHLGHRDRYDEAAALYAQVVEAESRHETARLGEITALVLGGRYEDAGRRLEEGHRVLPESISLTHLLARFLAAAPRAQLRRGEKAVELARPLFRRTPALSHGETLAMALAQAGDYAAAARLQETLLEQWQARGGATAVARRLEGNLERYRNAIPCCADAGPLTLLPPPVKPPSPPEDGNRGGGL